MLAIRTLLGSHAELTRYVVAGGTAFVVDFTILYLCAQHLGLHYLLGNLFGYAAGLLTSYLLNVHWVFDHRRLHVGPEFAVFNLIVLFGLALSELLMYLFVELAAVHYLTAKVGATGVIFVFNYIAKKRFLFSPASGPYRTDE